MFVNRSIIVNTGPVLPYSVRHKKYVAVLPFVMFKTFSDENILLLTFRIACHMERCFYPDV